MSIQTFIEDANTSINSIKEICNADISLFVIHQENGDIFPPTGSRATWRTEILPRVLEIIEYYEYFSKVTLNFHVLTFSEYFKNLYPALNNFRNALIDPNSQEKLANLFELLFKEIQKFEKFKNLEIYYSPKLTDGDLIKIYEEIKYISPNFDINDQFFSALNSSIESKKVDLIESLINIRNIYKRPNPTLQDGVSLKSYEDKIFINNSEINSAQELVTEAKEIIKDVKTNISKGNNEKLSHTFSTISKNLGDEIIKLNKWIIVLFCSIMMIFSLKAILIIFYEDSFKDIYNFILFLSLVLSCSALLTYFIKEKNHLRRLHDFYEMKGLELSALPDYMNELTREERNELIIHLAPSYFLGEKDHFGSPIPTIEKTQNLKSITTDLTQIINDIKSLKQ